MRSIQFNKYVAKIAFSIHLLKALQRLKGLYDILQNCDDKAAFLCAVEYLTIINRGYL